MSHEYIFLQIRWYVVESESGEKEEILDDSKITVHSNGSLSIPDIQKEDEGTYVVELSNSDGTTSLDIKVEVVEQIGQLPVSYIKKNMNLIPKRQKKILLASSKVRLKTFVRHFERVHSFIKI